MRKLIFACAVAVICVSAVAAIKSSKDGLLEKRGSARGKVVVALTTDAMTVSNATASVDELVRELRADYVFEVVRMAPGAPSEIMRRTEATVAVVFTEDDVNPALLVAPDEHWALVNVRALARGLATDRARERFLPSRCSKQLKRAFVAACGGFASSFKGNIMNVRETADLDLCPDLLPVDRISAALAHMRLLKMRPRDWYTYEDACEEGWAPAPTNDVQKAIWDKVHNPPTKPLKITYDRDKQKPVVK